MKNLLKSTVLLLSLASFSAFAQEAVGGVVPQAVPVPVDVTPVEIIKPEAAIDNAISAPKSEKVAVKKGVSSQATVKKAVKHKKHAAKHKKSKHKKKKHGKSNREKHRKSA